MPAVKHGGGGVMIWVCFAATGAEHLAGIESVMNHEVKLGHQDNDPKHTSKSVTEWQKYE